VTPRAYGACGRLVVVEHGGQLLSSYLDEPFADRAELALQLLSMVQVFWVRIFLDLLTLKQIRLSLPCAFVSGMLPSILCQPVYKCVVLCKLLSIMLVKSFIPFTTTIIFPDEAIAVTQDYCEPYLAVFIYSFIH